MSKEEVYAQIESSGKLPALPEVLFSLLNACDDPESSLGDIAAIIERDPSLLPSSAPAGKFGILWLPSKLLCY